MSVYQSRKSQITIKDEAQEMSTSWADVGDEFNVEGFTNLGLWIKALINDS